MYVYQITNLINGKKYYGITNDYKKRWGNERSYPSDPKRRQVIQEAIHKYGKENFQFEVLYSHLTIEEAIAKEAELIENNVDGYNIAPGGKYHPNAGPQYGEANGKSKLTDEEAQYIKDHRNLPEYVLYEEFSNKISYEAFKKCYLHKTYTHLTPKVDIYPFNFEFGNQFNNNSKLEYDEVVELRNKYANGVYWKDAYKDYADKYAEASFWNLYNGKSYKLVMPEVFTLENKKIHTSLSKQGINNGRSKLTIEDVKNIRRLHKEGVTNAELYKMYPQVSTTSIRDIFNYKTWKSVKDDD